MNISVIIPITYIHHSDPNRIVDERKRVELFSYFLKSLRHLNPKYGDQIIISECGVKPMFKSMCKGFDYLFTPHSGDMSVVPAQYAAMHASTGDMIVYMNPDIIIRNDLLDRVRQLYSQNNMNNVWTLFLGHHLICDSYYNLNDIIIRLNDRLYNQHSGVINDDDVVYRYLYNIPKVIDYIQVDQQQSVFDYTNNQIIVFPRKSLECLTDDGHVSYLSDVMWHWVLSYNGYTAKYDAQSPYFHVITSEQSQTYFSKTTHMRSHLYNWIDQYPVEMSPILVFDYFAGHDVIQYLKQYGSVIGIDRATHICDLLGKNYTDIQQFINGG